MDSNPATVTITLHPRFTLTTTKGGAGSGTITGPGIDCGADCTETYTTYPVVQTVTLTASANSGSVFSGWSGACAGTGSCVVTMSENRSVHATFTPLSTLLQINLSSVPGATIWFAGNGTFTFADSLAAVPPGKGIGRVTRGQFPS